MAIELQNLYILARRAKSTNNSENAQKYYEQILLMDPSSWEATFYSTYYQAMNCKIGEILWAANLILDCEETVFNLIWQTVRNPQERKKAVDEVASRLLTISDTLYRSYQNHYNGIDVSIRYEYTEQFLKVCCATRNIVYSGGDYIDNLSLGQYGDIAAFCWKQGVAMHSAVIYQLSDKEGNNRIIQEYNKKILEYDPSFKPFEYRSGGCYVATCVYGSYDCPQVWTLRRYRDNTLASTWYGRAFIHTYYAVSPTIVKLFGNTKWFRKMWRGRLDRMVADLQAKGFESTPYNDKKW